MFDLFGNLEEKQKALEAKLRDILIDEVSEDGLIKIQVDAVKRVRDISIDKSLINESDQERLQDMLIVTLNNALEKADIKAAAEAKKEMDDMLPGGLGSLFGG